MTTGLLTPDHGKAYVLGVDVWAQPRRAKGLLGVLPDGLRTFDRLSGAELLTYCGLLRGMEREQVLKRTQQLLLALGLADTGNKLVADYSAGMRKKINLACALIHAPSVLVLDEPFEAVDPVSAQAIIQILHEFVSRGGHRGALQPRDGYGGQAVHACGRNQCRASSVLWDCGAGG